MAAICYLLAATLTGLELTGILFDDNTTRGGAVNGIWLRLSAAFGCGVLLMTWTLYLIAWFLHVQCKEQDPLLYANILVLGFTAVLLFILWRRRAVRKSVPGWADGWIRDKKLFAAECVLYGLLFLFIAFTMSYVFHQTGNELKSGFSVFGDYAPHTAMMRSFSREANYPTQYPHFGGQDVKYHFMFQFLVGNLEYLGLRLDVAYNLAGTLALGAFLVMAGQMALRLSGQFLSAVLTALFFFFRSGTAFFRFAAEHLQAHDLLKTLASNTAFIGYTDKETWGLWNYNVYLNQRHLGFGLLLMAVLLWVFLDLLDSACDSQSQGLQWLKERFFSKTAWSFDRPERALLCGLVLGLASFWNGAAVIGALLILFGIAIFADHKPDLALLAVVTVVFSVLQTKIFIRGDAVSASFYWGFISMDKSFGGVWWYLIQITGISLVGLLPAAILARRRERCLIAAVFIPVLFSFTISLTPDVTVNHKYIMIAMAVAAVLWGVFLTTLLRGRWYTRLLAVVLAVLMTATGLYDFVVIIKDNDKNHRTTVIMDSPLTAWLNAHLTAEDLILTPEYAMNEVSISGVMMYLGWPYYAWSAGYDTYGRSAKAIEMYTTDSSERLQELVSEERINYILYEDNMTLEEHDCREDVIKATYPQVYVTEDGRIRIYEARKPLHRDAGLQ